MPADRVLVNVGFAGFSGPGSQGSYACCSCSDLIPRAMFQPPTTWCAKRLGDLARRVEQMDGIATVLDAASLTLTVRRELGERAPGKPHKPLYATVTCRMVDDEQAEFAWVWPADRFEDGAKPEIEAMVDADDLDEAARKVGVMVELRADA